MVNDIKAIDSKNELCKFADDITVGAPGYENNDTGTTEVEINGYSRLFPNLLAKIQNYFLCMC